MPNTNEIRTTAAIDLKHIRPSRHSPRTTMHTHWPTGYSVIKVLDTIHKELCKMTRSAAVCRVARIAISSMPVTIALDHFRSPNLLGLPAWSMPAPWVGVWWWAWPPVLELQCHFLQCFSTLQMLLILQILWTCPICKEGTWWTQNLSRRFYPLFLKINIFFWLAYSLTDSCKDNNGKHKNCSNEFDYT